MRGKIRDLSRGQTVVDIGCGDARFLALSRDHGSERRIGIEASRDMIRRIPEWQKECTLEWPDDRDIAKAKIEDASDTIIRGGFEEVLTQGCINADLSFSSFSLICLPNPSRTVELIRNCLKVRGRLIIVTNTFITDKWQLPENSNSRIDIGLNRIDEVGMSELEGKMFRQILELNNKEGEARPLGIQDYVHTIQAIADAFSNPDWNVLESKLYKPQGCHLANEFE